MNILAILQARVSSSRLPGKVLEPILGVPMLARQIERVKRSQLIEHLVVATSTDPTDDAIETLCSLSGVKCTRGDLNDVLDRFHQTAQLFTSTHIVRLTGDCPLADPKIIDHVVSRHLNSGADYTSNAIQPTWPDGLDVEVIRTTVLERAWREAHLASEREHVTPFIYKNPQLFKVAHVRGEPNYSGLRWTVDEPADLDFVKVVYERLYPQDPAFDATDILALLQKEPQLCRINAHLVRNSGYAKSLSTDHSE